VAGGKSVANSKYALYELKNQNKAEENLFEPHRHRCRFMTDSRTATLSEVVADALRQALGDGAYIPGERLIELTIAQEMNVSQNTVRDALRLLEQDGWVIKRARHGVFVRGFTEPEIEELYALRGAMESLVLGWAMESCTQETINELREIIIAARSQAEAYNAYGAREALFSFHAVLARIANRPQTADLLKRLINQTRLLENLRQAHVPRDRKQWRALVNAYAALLDTLESGDRSAAYAALSGLMQREIRGMIGFLDLI